MKYKSSLLLLLTTPLAQAHSQVYPHAHPHMPVAVAQDINYTALFLAFIAGVTITGALAFAFRKKGSRSPMGLFVAAIFALAIGGAACTKKEGTSNSQHSQLPGKTLRLYLKDNIKSGDPAGAYDTVSLDVIPQIYEALYQYNYFSQNHRIVPSLADGMPTYSKDRLTLTIKLKKGVLFQNDPCFEGGKGRELKAKDFLFGWKRHVMTDVNSEGFWIFDGKIAGFNEFKEKYKTLKSTVPGDLDALMAAEFEGFKALDDYTIQIKLLKPYPQLINMLILNFSSPVAIEAVKKYGPEFVNHPVGTGPFKAVTWEPQSKVVLTKNENFRQETFPTDIDPQFSDVKPYAGKTLPLVNNITFQIIREDQPRWLEMIAGNIDHIEIPKDNIDAALDPTNPMEPSAEMKAKGLGISTERGTSNWYIFFNTQDAFFSKHKEVRQAISMALNREDWIKIARGKGRGEAATEWNPAGLADRCGNTKLKYDYNLEKAKALLAKAGFPNAQGLPQFTFDLRGANTSNRQIGEWFVNSVAAIGIKAQFITNTFPAFLDKRQKKNLQIAYGGWVMDYPDVENNMALFFGPFKSPGANESSFENATYDELYKKLAVLEPGPEKRKLVCEMDAIIQEELPAIPGFYELRYRLYSKRLRNFHTAEMILNKYKYLDVDDSSPANKNN